MINPINPGQPPSDPYTRQTVMTSANNADSFALELFEAYMGLESGSPSPDTQSDVMGPGNSVSQGPSGTSQASLKSAETQAEQKKEKDRKAAWEYSETMIVLHHLDNPAGIPSSKTHGTASHPPTPESGASFYSTSA